MRVRGEGRSGKEEGRVAMREIRRDEESELRLEMYSVS